MLNLNEILEKCSSKKFLLNLAINFYFDNDFYFYFSNVLVLGKLTFCCISQNKKTRQIAWFLNYKINKTTTHSGKEYWLPRQS